MKNLILILITLVSLLGCTSEPTENIESQYQPTSSDLSIDYFHKIDWRKSDNTLSVVTYEKDSVTYLVFYSYKGGLHVINHSEQVKLSNK
jgi:hypothetical protein